MASVTARHLRVQAPHQKGDTQSPQILHFQKLTLLPHQPVRGPFLSLPPQEGHLNPPSPPLPPILNCRMLTQTDPQSLILWPILGVQSRESNLKINAASLNPQGPGRTTPPHPGPRLQNAAPTPILEKRGCAQPPQSPPMSSHFTCASPHAHPANGELPSEAHHLSPTSRGVAGNAVSVRQTLQGRRPSPNRGGDFSSRTEISET